MWRRLSAILFLSFSTSFLCAQRVLYSPFISTQPETRFEVIGKAGDYYWIQKSRRKIRTKMPADPWINDKESSFDIYDARMNLVRSIPSTTSANLVKTYFITGDRSFDQLLILPGDQKIIAVLNRYAGDGSAFERKDTIGYFPRQMKCEDFLMVRSQDKSKTLLLAFEPVPESPPKLHALLFDKNWNIIKKTVYSNPNISKPMVQYDVVDYPVEDYSSAPIKVGNDGQWLMTVPSNTNRNYLLFHFRGLDESFTSKEIKVPSTAIEETGLYLSNERQEGSVGILSRVHVSAVKNVRVANYSLTDCQFISDTSYSFNTLGANKVRNENMFEEYFMTVPGKGFLFLKEYGKMFSYEADGDDINTGGGELGAIRKGHNDVNSSLINKNDYTRYNNLAGTRNNFDRGDLTFYYLPAKSNDSCWSGIINKQQVTELGSSYLSYVFLPRSDRLFFLYNSFYKNRDQYSSATVLDQRGNPLNEGVEYWKINNTLVFQRARQISENELAIPYEKNSRNGFAIIHL
jgi:hypothetical protein